MQQTIWWEKNEIAYIWTQDHFRGTRTMGAVRSNGTNVSLPNCDLHHLEYVRFATTTLPQVNPDLECTRKIVDDAWTATIESQKFAGTPKKVKEAALAQVSLILIDGVQSAEQEAGEEWKGESILENAQLRRVR